ncbi:hypothetical protein C8R44DRAFT_865590 [Mycena epipterygia]|nr:hypothetical protein C8R44DRAFT_865590 [Mycena epipterygia]
MHWRMLKLAINLVAAHVTIRFDEEPWPNPIDVLELLCLQSLWISDPEILNYLKAPALKEIGFLPGLGQNLIHLEAFVARSGCTLRRFSFKGSITSTYICTNVLPKHPSITELIILVRNPSGVPTHDMTNALISCLTIPNPTGNAPQLANIYFGCKGTTYIDYSLFLKMLQSRRKPDNSALKCAALLTVSGPGPDPATVRGLDVLRQDGLEFLLLEGEEALDVMDDWMSSTRWT